MEKLHFSFCDAGFLLSFICLIQQSDGFFFRNSNGDDNSVSLIQL